MTGWTGMEAIRICSDFFPAPSRHSSVILSTDPIMPFLFKSHPIIPVSFHHSEVILTSSFKNASGAVSLRRQHWIRF